MFRKDIVLGGVCAGMFVMPQLMTARQLVTDGGDKPNIIFILADDMGYCDLSCYGNKYIETPNIDRLAATGTVFTQCYAGSGISSPSRCALMTGKNTGNTTIRDNFCIAGGIEGLKGTKTIRRMHLQPNDTTIATVLGAAGYRTCLVNKWHLDGFNPEATPLNRGFDEFYGWLISTAYSNDPYYYPYWRFNNEKLENVKENEGDKHIKHNTDLSTEDAIKFINRNKNNPFFQLSTPSNNVPSFCSPSIKKFFAACKSKPLERNIFLPLLSKKSAAFSFVTIPPVANASFGL